MLRQVGNLHGLPTCLIQTYTNTAATLMGGNSRWTSQRSWPSRMLPDDEPHKAAREARKLPTSCAKSRKQLAEIRAILRLVTLLLWS